MVAAKVKTVLASLLRMSGFFNFRCRTVVKNNAVIFMYHRIIPQKLTTDGDIPVQPGMYVSPESLTLHLSYLKTHFSLIPLSELVRRLQEGEDVSGCAVITLDDGWRDNYVYAFPILKKLKVPATIFLASGFIGTSRWFWPEEIGWAILAGHRKTVDLSSLPESLSHIMTREPYLDMGIEERVDKIIAEMKTWEEPRRRSVVESCALLRESTLGETKPVLMSWEEVREMSQSGLVKFGSHTVSHALLDQLSLEKAQQEVADSAMRVSREIGLASELFAYPNGNYSPQVLSMLPASGITAAVTTKRGLVDGDTPLLELPRIAVHEDVSFTQALFQWRLFVQ